VDTEEGESGGDIMGEDVQEGGELSMSRSLLEHTEGLAVYRGGELNPSRSLEQTDGVVF